MIKTSLVRSYDSTKVGFVLITLIFHSSFEIFHITSQVSNTTSRDIWVKKVYLEYIHYYFSVRRVLKRYILVYFSIRKDSPMVNNVFSFFHHFKNFQYTKKLVLILKKKLYRTSFQNNYH